MISKLIVFGNNRKECLYKLKQALDEYIIEGPLTTIDLHKSLLSQDDIKTGNFNINWLQKWLNSYFK